MRLINEEPFCPIAPICSFTNFPDAIEKINSTEYGLAAYIFTNDLVTAILDSERIEAGMVGVNAVTMATAQGPLGGIKNSGFGREGGSKESKIFALKN